MPQITQTEIDAAPVIQHTNDPIPDELCTHVELGAEMTGGWYFAASEPPVAVGMCHECVVWCKQNLESGIRYSDWTKEGQ